MATTLTNISMCTGQEVLNAAQRDVYKRPASCSCFCYQKTLSRKGSCSFSASRIAFYEGQNLQIRAVHRNLVIKCERGGDVLVSDGKENPSVNYAGEASCNQGKTHWISTCGQDIWSLAVPALFTQAIEPTAQLMETACVGRLGAIELAAVGVSTHVYNTVAKIFNVPLLSTTTSFVAEDVAVNEDSRLSSQGERCVVPAVSSALFLAVILAFVESSLLLLGLPIVLTMMGLSTGSPMRKPAATYLIIRALGAPANVLALTIQGVFRGFKDTKTPLYAMTMSNICNIALSPILTFLCRLGVVGAALATVSSQYLLAFLLLWRLHKQVKLIPPTLSSLRFDRFLKSGGFLLGRTVAVVFTMTFSASMAARQGPIAMAGHQILFQIWLATSLLSDALSVAGQALIANAFKKGDFNRVKEVSSGVLQIGLGLGLLLAVILFISLGQVSKLFTTDPAVLDVLRKGVLFVAATQPLNALAFVYDGLHYGVSDFKYAAYSMMVVGVLSSMCLLIAPSFMGLSGVWLGLALLMGLRTTAGWLRLNLPHGPWQAVRLA